MIAGLSRDELLREVLVRPREALVPHVDTQVIRRPGWAQLVTPSFREGGFNDVTLAVLAEDEADAVIDATLAQYAALGIRFKWVVGPDSRPRDLAQRLARRGMRHEPSLVKAVALADLRVEVPPDVRVEPVDAARVDDFADVLAAGWGLPRAPLADYQHRLLAAPGDRHHAFVAYLGDEPVGGANYVAFERTGYLLGAVVRPEARGRGVYRALIAARARHAAARGIVALTVQAMARTSAPILDRLGFVDLLELPVYLSR